MTKDHAARAEAWRAFNDWERSHPETERSFAELLRWMGDALRFARLSGDGIETTIEEKVAAVSRRHGSLAKIRVPRAP